MWSNKKIAKIVREAGRNLNLDWAKECEERESARLAEERLEDKINELIKQSGTNDKKTLQELLINRTQKNLNEIEEEITTLKKHEKAYKHGKIKNILHTIATGVLYFVGGAFSALSIPAFMSGETKAGVLSVLLGVMGTLSGCGVHVISNDDHKFMRQETEEQKENYKKLESANKEKAILEAELKQIEVLHRELP